MSDDGSDVGSISELSSEDVVGSSVGPVAVEKNPINCEKIQVNLIRTPDQEVTLDSIKYYPSGPCDNSDYSKVQRSDQNTLYKQGTVSGTTEFANAVATAVANNKVIFKTPTILGTTWNKLGSASKAAAAGAGAAASAAGTGLGVLSSGAFHAPGALWHGTKTGTRGALDEWNTRRFRPNSPAGLGEAAPLPLGAGLGEAGGFGQGLGSPAPVAGAGGFGQGLGSPAPVAGAGAGALPLIPSIQESGAGGGRALLGGGKSKTNKKKSRKNKKIGRGKTLCRRRI